MKTSYNMLGLLDLKNKPREEVVFKITSIFTILNTTIIPIIIYHLFDYEVSIKYFITVGLGFPYLLITFLQLWDYDAVSKAESKSKCAWRDYEKFKLIKETARIKYLVAKNADQELKNIRRKMEQYDRLSIILKIFVLLFSFIVFFNVDISSHLSQKSELEERESELLILQNKLNDNINLINNKLDSINNKLLLYQANNDSLYFELETLRLNLSKLTQ